MSYQELSADGENRFDHLTDVESKTAGEAWEAIRIEHANSMGGKALLILIEDNPKTGSKKTNTFRGPAGDNDSASDPNWNSPLAPIGHPIFAKTELEFRDFALGAHIDTIKSNIRNKNLTEVEAAALMRLAEERRQNV